ncbi:MAG: hypothetical protein Kow0092_29440 [Deferrisomatales bacterium]
MTNTTARRPIRLALLVWAVVWAAPGLLPAGARRSGTAEARTVAPAVEGMTCPSCTFAVKAALQELDGVADVRVSFRKKKAVVAYDPARVTPEEMVSAIGETGFRASLPGSGGDRERGKGGRP